MDFWSHPRIATMQYLCLFYQNEVTMGQLSEQEWQQLLRECTETVRMLESSQHLVDCNRLAPTDTATCIRIRERKLSISDGPFAETKEQLAGYCLLEARDLNQVLHLASLMPQARYGCIEIRPVRELMTTPD